MFDIDGRPYGGAIACRVLAIDEPPLTRTRVAPLPDISLTPQGWSPISLGSVQISVPSSWLIEDPGRACSSDALGVVFINQTPRYPPAGMQGPGCPPAPNIIEMSTAGAKVLSNSHRTVINSISASERTVRFGPTTGEVVRALGVTVEARGPFAGQVLTTLTHSPLSVLLDSSVNSIPNGWRRVHFGGISFAVPGQWMVQGEPSTAWGGCPGNITSDYLVLSTAQYVSAPGCAPPAETAGYLAANPGMVLGSGPVIDAAAADATCDIRNGLRICIDPPPSPVGGFSPGQELNLLTAQIEVPGQRTIDQVEIGLTGTGITPLHIFDSMQAST